LCCFPTSNTKGKPIFRYRLSPETFGYTLVCSKANTYYKLVITQFSEPFIMSTSAYSDYVKCAQQTFKVSQCRHVCNC